LEETVANMKQTIEFCLDAGGVVAFAGEGFVKRELADLGRRAGVEVFGQDEYVPEWKAG
jgi:hypothetical protein